ncbi:DUF1836 domain-containing protein [Streptococcus suis]
MNTRLSKNESDHQLPYWEDLPEIDLYIDQVLLYVHQATQFSPSKEDKGLTASMVNNYVKHKHLEKPIKKKYQKHQLARLIALTYLKNVFSIQEISQTLNILQSHYSSDRLYNYFVDCMNENEIETAPEIIRYACQTLKLYRKTHQLALELERG